MQQSKLGSLIESTANIVIGYVIALLSQLAVFPMFGIHIPISTNIAITTRFMVIGLIRSYVLRRRFNARLHAVSLRLAARTGV